MVDTIAHYMKTVEAWPVASQDRPGDVRSRLPAEPPTKGLGLQADPVAAWDAVFDDITRIILPGLMHWQHPSFFGYFPCNASGPAILGELLSAGLGVQGMLWQTSPACTELETHMLDWAADMFDLPACFRSDAGSEKNREGDREGNRGGDRGGDRGGGVIQGTASEATLCAILAARQRWRTITRQRDTQLADSLGQIGLVQQAIDQRFAVICSESAHSSVTKAAMLAGIIENPDDQERLWLVRTDAQGRMNISHLREILDRAKNNPTSPIPLCCVATMGTTGVGAMDRIDAIADALAGRDIWLHVDGAWAGSALVCPEFRSMAVGLERADSLCINPHKWLLTNFDCDLFWTRHVDDLVAAMSINPEYLRNAASASGSVIDYRDWQVPLGRRFRSLKLWFVIRHYGIEGLRAHIREHVRLAQMVERFVKYDDRFELVMPRSLSLVCFGLRQGSEATSRLIERVNASGKAFLTHASMPHAPGGRAENPAQTERVFARFAIGATQTEERHVRAAWKRIVQAADEVG